jgi:chemotaxis protein MotB
VASSRRRRGGHDGEHESEERWLLTYADMITLLMALFIILFSISAINVSKYRSLQTALKAAFSGSILPGGKAIMKTGSDSSQSHSPTSDVMPSIRPLTPNAPTPSTANALSQAAINAAAIAQEQQDFRHLKQEIDRYARQHGFASQVQTTIERRGLAVRVLTDKLLFDSGQATLKPAGLPLLGEVANLLNIDQKHPIVVEGHTDNQPISSAQFPSNWELSTARATTVVRFLIGHHVRASRLAAAGYADLHPIASNGTDYGRQLNRRVEIVLQRLNPAPTQLTNS